MCTLQSRHVLTFENFCLSPIFSTKKGKVPSEFGGSANDQYFSLIDKSQQDYEAPPAAARAFAGIFFGVHYLFMYIFFKKKID
jgi:hypothetical protein